MKSASVIMDDGIRAGVELYADLHGISYEDALSALVADGVIEVAEDLSDFLKGRGKEECR